MRRLVLVLFAFALLCQGAWAASSLDCRLGPCCASAFAEAAAAAGSAHADGDHALQGNLQEGVQEGVQDADMHTPCDARAAPCDDEACHCHAPGLTGLLIQLPALAVAGPEVIVAGVYLRHVPEHVPDSPLRPPHTAAC